MIRPLFNLLALLSAVLLVASVVAYFAECHFSVGRWEVYNAFGVVHLWKHGRSSWNVEWDLRSTFFVFLVLPACWMGVEVRRHNVRRGRAERGLCVRCGYDLRGTPERCPECGEQTGRGIA